MLTRIVQCSKDDLRGGQHFLRRAAPGANGQGPRPRQACWRRPGVSRLHALPHKVGFAGVRAEVADIEPVAEIARRCHRNRVAVWPAACAGIGCPGPCATSGRGRRGDFQHVAVRCEQIVRPFQDGKAHHHGQLAATRQYRVVVRDVRGRLAPALQSQTRAPLAEIFRAMPFVWNGFAPVREETMPPDPAPPARRGLANTWVEHDGAGCTASLGHLQRHRCRIRT